MSVVEFALKLAGDVSSFTPSVRTEMKSAIAARADIDPSAVMVTVTSGSVLVGVRVLTPTVMATSVQSAMANATSSPISATAMLASVTGISIAVLAVVTLPFVANVQPSPPPQGPPGALNSAAGGAITILVIAVPAAIGGLLCCLAVVCWWTRRRQVELRRKDVNNWLSSMSVRRASINPLQQHQAHACSKVRAIDSPPLSGGGGGGGGGGGIEMSGRFDRHSSETEGSSRADGAEGGARPAMADVIGASGSNTPTMAERSRMQDMPDMVSQQKEEVHVTAVMSARDTRVSTKGPDAPTKDDASPPPYAPQTASLEGESHAIEVQGASWSLGGGAPVVMPHLGEDIVGSVLQEVDAANFYAGFETELNA